MHRTRPLILSLSLSLCLVVFTACRPQPTPAPAPTPPPTPTPTASAEDKLQYEDLIVGAGARPMFNQTVRVRYTGRLPDGTKIDSNEDSMTPILEFKLGSGEMIKGWDLGIGGGQGIPPMRVGGRRKLTIPANLAYGAMGRGTIPPNATLVFEVGLVGVR